MTDKEICKALGITQPMLDQLQAYVRQAEAFGWYWGPQVHFNKRHRQIKAALNMGEEEKNNVQNLC